MQVLIIAGNVGKDAELRRTNSGDAVLGFSLAVDNGKDKSGNRRVSTWYDCSIWGKRAESLQNYITKGTKLTLTGRPTAREHNGKAYLGISVNDLTFMGGSSSGGNRGGDYGGGAGGYDYQAPQQNDMSNGNQQNMPARDLDDEIPF